jgi:hypothetical protein
MTKYQDSQNADFHTPLDPSTERSDYLHYYRTARLEKHANGVKKGKSMFFVSEADLFFYGNELVSAEPFSCRAHVGIRRARSETMVRTKSS